MKESCTSGNHCNIGCDAENCAYNKDGTLCCAEHIKVDGKRARSTSETCCKTFEPKNY